MSKQKKFYVRIAGDDFEVNFESPNGDLGEQYQGSIDYRARRVTIDTRASQPKKVLLHELIHAADKFYGCHDLTEKQALSLENGLWAIFRDNRALAEAIFGD